MKRYTKKNNVFIIEQYFKNNKGLAVIVRTILFLIDDDRIVAFQVQKIH